MSITELIDKHSLSSAYFAKRLGMARSTFNNKMKGNNGSTFTGPEMVRVLELIAEIKKDLNEFIMLL